MSVIVPVYNSTAYLEASIRSVFGQTLPAEDIEIVTVDDGSTDESLAVLHRLALEHPRMIVHSQPNSGSASRPRNAALDLATGTYVFCLDSDDMLTPHALERLVTTADRVGADVVLGRMRGIGGRGAPRTTFRRTVLDADLVDDHLFHAMTPHKLFRRSHLEEQGLRFPEDISIGEDVLFVATAELTARRIAILADEDYYLWRQRANPTEHLSRSGAGFEMIFDKASRLRELIHRYEPDDARRDALKRRVFRYVYHGLLRNIALEEDVVARTRMADRVRERFAADFTPGLRAHLSPQTILPLRLLFAGDRDDDLVAVVRHARYDTRKLRLTTEDGAVVVGLPPDLARRIPLEWRRCDRPVTTTARLVEARHEDDSLVLRVAVGGKLVQAPPHAVTAHLEPRSTARPSTPLRVDVVRRGRRRVWVTVTIDPADAARAEAGRVVLSAGWGATAGTSTPVRKRPVDNITIPPHGRAPVLSDRDDQVVVRQPSVRRTEARRRRPNVLVALASGVRDGFRDQLRPA